ncbi:MAG TPA: APC family permease [Longimicrobiales bacterium]|nr:APC family permease [Longimicrobiales bacterium]
MTSSRDSTPPAKKTAPEVAATSGRRPFRLHSQGRPDRAYYGRRLVNPDPRPLMPDPETVASTERPELKRAISGLGFFALAFGSMIGVGWITALGGWFERAGPTGAILAFAAGGALMLLIGLCYAEVTPMLPVTGGEVAYAYKAFGTSEAFVIGWFLAFGYLSVSAFEAVSVGLVLSYLFPRIDVVPLYEIAGSTVFASHLVLAFLFTAIITAINYFGVGIASRVQVALTALFLLCAVLFVASGVASGDVANLAPHFGDRALGAGGLGGMLAVFVTVPFWFVGFDTIPQAAEERREGSSLRRLGLYVVLAIVGSTLFYIAVIFGAGVTGPWRDIVDEPLPTAAAFASAFESPVTVRLVLVAGLIGLLTSWNGFFLAGSRVLFSLGRGRIIDESFGRTHDRYGTPAAAVLFSGGVTFVAALLGRGAILAFVDVGSFCIALAFLGVALSLLRLRRDFPELERPYRMPGGRVLPHVAAAGALFILCVMLFPGSPSMLVWPLEWAILGALVLAGLVFWRAAGAYRGRLTEDERSRLILEEYA